MASSDETVGNDNTRLKKLLIFLVIFSTIFLGMGFYSEEKAWYEIFLYLSSPLIWLIFFTIGLLFPPKKCMYVYLSYCIVIFGYIYFADGIKYMFKDASTSHAAAYQLMAGLSYIIYGMINYVNVFICFLIYEKGG